MQNKFKILFIIMICMPVIIITGNTKILYCQNSVDLKLTNQSNIKYCNDIKNDTNLIITIGVGNILKSDSLYGFDFMIKYDTTKLFFDKPIYQNTFSEFITEKGVFFYGKTGEIRCYALNTNPIFGNHELIGFYGGYINSNCWDSALVEIEDYELDDFNRSIKVIDSLWIVPKNRMPESYTISPKFSVDTLNFNKNKYQILSSNIYNDNKVWIDSIILNYRFSSNNKYRINNISKLSDSILLEKLYQDENNLQIKIKFANIRYDILKFIELEIEKLDTINDNTTYLVIEPLKLSNCNCINTDNIKIDSVLMYKKNDTISSVDVNENEATLKIEGKSNGFTIANNQGIEINKIQLFNYEGKMINCIEVNNNYKLQFYEINNANGIYMVNVITKNTIIRKSVLIYN